MAELPHMPIATDALLADAGDLPNDLFGAYCRLLFRWWREGAQPEPNERRLARWARTDADGFDELSEFLTRTDDGWTQKRLMATHATQLTKRDDARTAVNLRWHEAGKHEGAPRADCPACADELRSKCAGNTVVSDTPYDRMAVVSTDAIPTMNHEPLSTSKEVGEAAPGGDGASAGGGVVAIPVRKPAHPYADPNATFDQFWSDYPHRTSASGKTRSRGSRKLALNEWRKLKPEQRLAAHRDLPRYRLAAGKMPLDGENYLAQQTWNDIEDIPASATVMPRDGPPGERRKHRAEEARENAVADMRRKIEAAGVE